MIHYTVQQMQNSNATIAESIAIAHNLLWKITPIDTGWVIVEHTYLLHKAKINIVLHDSQFVIVIKARFGDVCPGIPGQLRHICVQYSNLESAIHSLDFLFKLAENLNVPLYDAVFAGVAANQLILDDGSLMRTICQRRQTNNNSQS